MLCGLRYGETPAALKERLTKPTARTAETAEMEVGRRGGWRGMGNDIDTLCIVFQILCVCICVDVGVKEVEVDGVEVEVDE